MFLVTPDPVVIDGFFLVNTSECSSHRVQWQLLDTGCAVDYNIEFLDSKNVTLGIETINDYSSVFCTNDYGYASSVVMWATFNGVKGKSSLVVPLQMTPRTTATTTLTTVNTASKGKNLMKIVKLNGIR